MRVLHVMHHDDVRPRLKLRQQDSQDPLSYLEPMCIPEHHHPLRVAQACLGSHARDVLPQRTKVPKPAGFDEVLESWYRASFPAKACAQADYFAIPQDVAGFGEGAGRITIAASELQDQVRFELHSA